jgi:hypothetical protein
MRTARRASRAPKAAMAAAPIKAAWKPLLRATIRSAPPASRLAVNEVAMAVTTARPRAEPNW